MAARREFLLGRSLASLQRAEKGPHAARAISEKNSAGEMTDALRRELTESLSLRAPSRPRVCSLPSLPPRPRRPEIR
eukprot:9495884-Pyramimonas_sp.AAC.1